MTIAGREKGTSLQCDVNVQLLEKNPHRLILSPVSGNATLTYDNKATTIRINHRGEVQEALDANKETIGLTVAEAARLLDVIGSCGMPISTNLISCIHPANSERNRLRIKTTYQDGLQITGPYVKIDHKGMGMQTA
ncbi:MAG: hypothetical protein LBF56_03925 [Holosporales bacterium]|nr:hypothetical protein [Holosporales bacterium]